MERTPSPSQAGQRPPSTLKEKREASKPRIRAASVAARRLRTPSQAPT